MNQNTPKPEEWELVLYQVVAARRVSYDNMIWQAPFLSLAAQAFLLTIALSSDALALGRFLAASLGVLSSLASIQLMLKHRVHEVADSKWLEDFEKKYFPEAVVHGKERPYAEYGVPTRWRSTRVWIGVLAAFGLVAFIAWVLALVEALGCSSVLSAAQR